MVFEAIPDQNLSVYVNIAIPLAKRLSDEIERIRALQWISKLIMLKDSEHLGLVLKYMKLLLFLLPRKKLLGPFLQEPPSGRSLDSLPREMKVFEIALNLMRDGIKDSGTNCKFFVDRSANRKEYVAVQSIPDTGLHCYFAVSPDEPLAKWENFISKPSQVSKTKKIDLPELPKTKPIPDLEFEETGISEEDRKRAKDILDRIKNRPMLSDILETTELYMDAIEESPRKWINLSFDSAGQSDVTSCCMDMSKPKNEIPYFIDKSVGGKRRYIEEPFVLNRSVDGKPMLSMIDEVSVFGSSMMESQRNISEIEPPSFDTSVSEGTTIEEFLTADIFNTPGRGTALIEFLNSRLISKEERDKQQMSTSRRSSDSIEEDSKLKTPKATPEQKSVDFKKRKKSVDFSPDVYKELGITDIGEYLDKIAPLNTTKASTQNRPSMPDSIGGINTSAIPDFFPSPPRYGPGRHPGLPDTPALFRKGTDGRDRKYSPSEFGLTDDEKWVSAAEYFKGDIEPLFDPDEREMNRMLNYLETSALLHDEEIVSFQELDETFLSIPEWERESWPKIGNYMSPLQRSQSFPLKTSPNLDLLSKIPIPDDMLDPYDFIPQKDESTDLFATSIPQHIHSPLIASPQPRDYFKFSDSISSPSIKPEEHSSNVDTSILKPAEMDTSALDKPDEISTCMKMQESSFSDDSLKLLNTLEGLEFTDEDFSVSWDEIYIIDRLKKEHLARVERAKILIEEANKMESTNEINDDLSNLSSQTMPSDLQNMSITTPVRVSTPQSRITTPKTPQRLERLGMYDLLSPTHFEHYEEPSDLLEMSQASAGLPPALIPRPRTPQAPERFKLDFPELSPHIPIKWSTGKPRHYVAPENIFLEKMNLVKGDSTLSADTTLGTNISLYDSQEELFMEDPNAPHGFRMPGVDRYEDAEQRFKKLQSLRHKIPKPPRIFPSVRQPPARRVSIGGTQTVPVYNTRRGSAPSRIERFPEVPEDAWNRLAMENDNISNEQLDSLYSQPELINIDLPLEDQLDLNLDYYLQQNQSYLSDESLLAYSTDPDKIEEQLLIEQMKAAVEAQRGQDRSDLFNETMPSYREAETQTTFPSFGSSGIINESMPLSYGGISNIYDESIPHSFGSSIKSFQSPSPQIKRPFGTPESAKNVDLSHGLPYIRGYNLPSSPIVLQQRRLHWSPHEERYQRQRDFERKALIAERAGEPPLSRPRPSCFKGRRIDFTVPESSKPTQMSGLDGKNIVFDESLNMESTLLGIENMTPPSFASTHYGDTTISDQSYLQNVSPNLVSAEYDESLVSDMSRLTNVTPQLVESMDSPSPLPRRSFVDASTDMSRISAVSSPHMSFFHNISSPANTFNSPQMCNLPRRQFGTPESANNVDISHGLPYIRQHNVPHSPFMPVQRRLHWSPYEERYQRQRDLEREAIIAGRAGEPIPSRFRPPDLKRRRIDFTVPELSKSIPEDSMFSNRSNIFNTSPDLVSTQYDTTVISDMSRLSGVSSPFLQESFGSPLQRVSTPLSQRRLSQASSDMSRISAVSPPNLTLSSIREQNSPALVIPPEEQFNIVNNLTRPRNRKITKQRSLHDISSPKIVRRRLSDPVLRPFTPPLPSEFKVYRRIPNIPSRSRIVHDNIYLPGQSSTDDIFSVAPPWDSNMSPLKGILKTPPTSSTPAPLRFNEDPSLIFDGDSLPSHLTSISYMSSVDAYRGLDNESTPQLQDQSSNFQGSYPEFSRSLQIDSTIPSLQQGVEESYAMDTFMPLPSPNARYRRRMSAPSRSYFTPGPQKSTPVRPAQSPDGSVGWECSRIIHSKDCKGGKKCCCSPSTTVDSSYGYNEPPTSPLRYMDSTTSSRRSNIFESTPIDLIDSSYSSQQSSHSTGNNIFDTSPISLQDSTLSSTGYSRRYPYATSFRVDPTGQMKPYVLPTGQLFLQRGVSFTPREDNSVSFGVDSFKESDLSSIHTSRDNDSFW